MTNTHTPGPWAIDHAEDGRLIISAPEAAIAFPIGSQRPLERFDANAALIAAAPDLLAALKAIMALQGTQAAAKEYREALAYASKPETVAKFTAAIEAIEQREQAAYAAIAKAEGK